MPCFLFLFFFKLLKCLSFQFCLLNTAWFLETILNVIFSMNFKLSIHPLYSYEHHFISVLWLIIVYLICILVLFPHHLVSSLKVWTLSSSCSMTPSLEDFHGTSKNISSLDYPKQMSQR